MVPLPQRLLRFLPVFGLGVLAAVGLQALATTTERRAARECEGVPVEVTVTAVTGGGERPIVSFVRDGVAGEAVGSRPEPRVGARAK